MGRLNILQSNLIVSIIGLIMIASTVSLLLYVWEDDKLDDRRQIAQDKKIERLAQENVELNERQIVIQEQQGNISEAARRGLINAINTTFYETIPGIHEQFQIHKEQVAKHDQSLKDAIQIAVSNFSKILDNQRIILERIDNNTLVSNTTVTAIN